MSLKETLLADMKEAMKSKDVIRKNTIQLVRSAILQKEKDTQKDVSEDEILTILTQEVKKRKDALVDFQKGNREDLVKDTTYEIHVLTQYLPKQLSEEEILKLVQDVIAQVGATTMKDMGKVMGVITSKVKGKADNSVVSRIVKQCLS